MKAGGFLPVLLGLGAVVLVLAGLWAAASLMAPLTVALFMFRRAGAEMVDVL